MKVIQNKIREEIEKEMALSELALDAPYKDAIRFRAEKEKTFDKIKFLKGLNNAIHKEKRETKCKK